MNIKIVKGTCEHIKDCEEALLKSSLGEQYFSSEKSALKTIEEALDKGNLYVAITDNICVGFIFYITNGAFHSYPYLHLIAVKEEYRGKGIGKQLVEFFENISGKDKFFLAVADYNEKAKRFYESIGYCQVGEIPGLYRKGITEYIMMKVK